MSEKLAIEILKQATLETTTGACEKCPRKDKNKTCIGCLDEAKEKILSEVERLGNELQVQIEDNTRLNEYIEAKDKEIERLNNIINDMLNRQNEALRYIGNHLLLDSRYKHGNGDKELTLVRNILNKHIKELKGSD